MPCFGAANGGWIADKAGAGEQELAATSAVVDLEARGIPQLRGELSFIKET